MKERAADVTETTHFLSLSHLSLSSSFYGRETRERKKEREPHTNNIFNGSPSLHESLSLSLWEWKKADKEREIERVRERERGMLERVGGKTCIPMEENIHIVWVFLLSLHLSFFISLSHSLSLSISLSLSLSLYSVRGEEKSRDEREVKHTFERHENDDEEDEGWWESPFFLTPYFSPSNFSLFLSLSLSLLEKNRQEERNRKREREKGRKISIPGKLNDGNKKHETVRVRQSNEG